MDGTMRAESGRAIEGHRENVWGYSLIRVLACIAVLLLHTVYTAVRLQAEQVTAMEHLVSMGIVNLMMWAVPCFVMVSGALLLAPERQVSYQKIFGKYIKRIVAALILFGMIFRIFDIVMDQEVLSISALMQGVLEIFSGTSWSHMWYLYLIIGLYLLLPFYRMVAAAAKQRDLCYLLLIYGIFLSLIPMIRALSGQQVGFYIHVSTIYPFYFFLGYGIQSGQLPLNKKMSLCLLLLGSGVILIGNWCRWRYDLPALEALQGYASIPVILQATGVFGLLRDAGIPAWGRGFLMALDRCSFGIYLLHMIFVRLVLRYMNLNPYAQGPVWGIVYFAGLILGNLVISWLITALMRRIPLIREAV